MSLDSHYNGLTFKSYLTGRSQFVKVNDTISDPTPLTFGVPQGSVGGRPATPFFSVPFHTKHIFQKHSVQYHCYADDIQVFVSFPPSRTELSTAIKQLESCIEIKSWMESNGLKLNDSKSEFLLLGSTQMLSKVKSETIEICIGKNRNNSIKPSNTVRNLGVVYDSNLSFKNHITYLSQSVRFQLRNLGFIRKYLTKSAAEQLIHALISSRLDFCNSLFCNLPQKDMIRMQRLQNCAARLLTYTMKTMHITPVLRSLHWLPVHKRITFKILLLVYRTLHKFAPSYLQNTLNVYKPSHNLCSSTSQALQIPRIKHSMGERAFSHVGPKIWNSLPMSLRNASSLNEFKSNLKSYLFNLPQQ